MAIYKKIDKASDTLEYFAHRQWVWTDHNVQALFNKLDPEDQELFFFDMGQMKWEYYAEAMGLGLRVYLVHDDIHTLPAARKKYQR
jgi:Male sterility protein.